MFGIQLKRKFNISAIILVSIFTVFQLSDAFYISNLNLTQIHDVIAIIVVLIAISNVLYENTVTYEVILFLISAALLLVGVKIEFLMSFLAFYLGRKFSIEFRAIFTVFITFVILYYLQLLIDFPYYAVEKQFIERMVTYQEIRLISSNLFANSNGAGATYSALLLMWHTSENKREKSRGFINIFPVVFLSFLIYISRSNAALVFLAVIFGIRLRKYRPLLFKLAGVILALLVVYGLVYTGFSLPYNVLIRLERYAAFFSDLLYHGYIILVPRIFFGALYTESTLLDMFLNYGVWILPFLIRLFKYIPLIGILMLMTNSVFTPFPAFIFGIIYQIRVNENIYQIRRFSREAEL
jgi:hypothetical protein